MVVVVSGRVAWSALGWLGGVIIAAALAWWGMLFPSVVANTGLTLAEAVPCVASNSQLCRMATALCGAPHFLGVTSYSPLLFWCGWVLVCVRLLGGCVRCGGGG